MAPDTNIQNRSFQRWLPVLTLVLSLLASTVAALGVAGTAAAAPPCVAEATDAGSALAMAQRCGSRVENLASRTGTTQVFANPQGHWTAEQSLRPRWVKAPGGTWREADATLRRNSDGTVTPTASVFTMTFSGGGTTPLAELRKDGRAMSLSWPRPLPEPRLQGSAAVYPEVLPGVDLEVRAEVDGFVHLLVVKNRAAAASPELRKIRMGLRGEGVSFRGDPSGGISAVNPGGEVWFTSATASMWDSRDSAAGGEPRTAKVSARLVDDALELEPDAGLLSDPVAQFPIYIDPAWTGEIKDNAFTMVWSRSDTQNSSFWQRTNALNSGDFKGEMGAGRTCDSSSNGSCTSTQYIVRSLFRMSLSGAFGKHILGAKFTIEQRWSWRCFAGNTTRLWITGGIDAGTTWNNQPGWDGNYVAETVGNHKADGSSGCGGVGTIEFGVKHFVEHALAEGWADLTVGLRPANESDVAYWKRFRYSSPRLSIDFNSVPTVGARSTNPATACVVGDGTTAAPNAPLLNDATPDLRVVTDDADTENDLTGSFEVQEYNSVVGGVVRRGWGQVSAYTDPVGRANGATSVVTPSLSTGTYRWRVRIADPWSYTDGSSGTDLSAWSGWCEFRVDVTPPDVTVTSPEYPQGCAPCGGVGTTGRFTFGSNHSDVVGYWWGFSDPPSNWAPGRTATVHWTPTTGGPRTLYVISKDEGSNVSGRYGYAFTVDGARPIRAHWRLAESAGAGGLADSSGNGFTATPQGGVTLGAPGRFPAATAASFDGVDDQAATNGPVVADTGRSFSVSAWVKLGSKANGSHSIVGQGGTANSAFVLEHVKSDTVDVWKFTAPTADSATATYPGAESPNGSPRVGRWTHLTGVYDSAARTLKLYVDGALVQTRTGVTTWRAGGNLYIGGTQRLHGSIADLKVWERVLLDSEIKAMTDAAADAKTGEYHFSETDSTFALDSSGYGNDLTLRGGASIPSQGAGYDGTGMLLLDRTGEAVANGSAVHTSQSFTVSAWVRMDDTTLPDSSRTVLSQTGQYVSGFYLGYRVANGDPGTARWSFSLPGTDAVIGGTGWVNANSAVVTSAVLGKWVHLRGTYDAASGSVRLYVNGSLAGSANRGDAHFDTAGPLMVGAAWYTPQAGAPQIVDRWLGAIDEARVHAGVVTTPVADWRFDSCTGTPVKCENAATPGTNQVTLNGGASWDSDGYGEGSGLALDGSGKATSATSAVDTGSSFTVSAWVKLTDTTSTRCAVCFDGDRNDAFVLGYRRGVNTWQFWGHHSDADDTGEVVATSSIPAALDTWTHLTGVYDVANGEIRLYVNGDLAGSARFTSGWTAKGPVVIGRERYRGAELNFWKGAVDDVTIHQYAGSAAVRNTWVRGTYPAGSVLRSETNNFELRMQPDGNLVLYHGEVPQWDTGTWGHAGAYTVLQGDGNLVVYASNGAPLWDTRTYQTSGERLVLHNDGELVLYGQGNQILWRR